MIANVAYKRSFLYKRNGFIVLYVTMIYYVF